MIKRWINKLLRKIIGRDKEPLMVRYPKGYKENQEAMREYLKSISAYVEAQQRFREKNED